MGAKVLGISLGYNTSASVVCQEEGVISAVSEERLTGNRNTKMFPINAIKECLLTAGMLHDKTINVALCSYELINERTLMYFDTTVDVGEFGNIYDFIAKYIIEKCGLCDETNFNFFRQDHHESHRATASFLSELNYCDGVSEVTVTCDGFGDGVSATITDHESGQVIAKEGIETSLGLVYQSVTGSLGFEEHKHEGKVTSLSAFGVPLYKDFFKDTIIKFDESAGHFIPLYLKASKLATRSSNTNIYKFNNMLQLKGAVKKITKGLLRLNVTKEDIAASLQAYVEESVVDWISFNLEKSNMTRVNLNLSGGLFNNINIVRAIKDKVKQIENVYVSPYAGDEGNSIGAAALTLTKLVGETNVNKAAFKKVGLYPMKSRSHDLVTVDSDVSVISNPSHNELVHRIASSLVAGKVVCISRGDSEFGGRSLGNHSILFDATDEVIADKVRNALERESFMPFAPVVLDRFKSELFHGTEGLESALKYMGVSVSIKDVYAEMYKQAVHHDGSVRPQVIDRKDNKLLHDVLEMVHLFTGKMMLINTSFNLHGKPIVYKNQDAVDCFDAIGADMLVLDRKVIVRGEI